MGAGNEAPGEGRVLEAALDATAVAEIVIGIDGTLLAANAQARATFGLDPRDLGRPFRDLELSYRPVELRSRIDQALQERRAVFAHEVRWGSTPDTARTLDVHIIPLSEPDGTALGALVSFHDATGYQRLRDELHRSKTELETAYEELQSTVEELQTVNEELQSTNEELETVNEELQSTNEELQSTNEELETVSEELRLRTDDVNEGNAFLSAVMGSLQGGVVVLTPDMTVRAWNRRAEAQWGLRAEEAEGRHFLSLDIGLPVERLSAGLRRIVAGEADCSQVTVRAVNRVGRSVTCEVSISPLHTPVGVAGVVVLMTQHLLG